MVTPVQKGLDPALARLDPQRRAALARLMATRERASGVTARQQAGAVTARPAGDGLVVCSPAQRRIWVADRLGTVPAATFGLRLRGRLDVAALRRAFVAVAARHEVMRTVYVM